MGTKKSHQIISLHSNFWDQMCGLGNFTETRLRKWRKEWNKILKFAKSHGDKTMVRTAHQVNYDKGPDWFRSTHQLNKSIHVLNDEWREMESKVDYVWDIEAFVNGNFGHLHPEEYMQIGTTGYGVMHFNAHIDEVMLNHLYYLIKE